MFHSNHGPISYRFRDRWRLQSDIAKFSHPLYFAPALKGFLLELGTGAVGQKTRMMGLSGRQIILTISSAVWMQSTNVTDGQTDGRTPGDSKDRANAQRTTRGNKTNDKRSSRDRRSDLIREREAIVEVES